MGKILILFQQVTLRYPDGTAFANVNFRLDEGQHIALQGQNTPLKNALMDALCGRVAVAGGYKLVDLNFGNASIAGVLPKGKAVLVAARHSFKNLAHTSDFYYQQRFNSCDADNAPDVATYLQHLADLERDARWTYTKVVKQLSLAELLHKRVIMLSNGETKRVLIGAALLQQPVLLVLQNPLAGLDVAARETISALVDIVANAGTTVVLSTQGDALPHAITHIASIEHDANINIVPRLAYKKEHAIPPVSTIDIEAIKALINPHLPLYNIIVQMNKVHLAYGDKVILDDINWTIRQGERWVLAGENGAGKSSLLSLINGDNPQAFANDIVLFDRRKGTGESIWDIKRKTGFFSPELYQYFPVETLCQEAVESGFYDTVGLFRRSDPQRAAVALQWLQVLGIGSLARRPLRNILPVQQRLCLLARTLVKNPVLLILDEPCQGFDEQQTEDFKALIDCICNHSNVTIIYVSHYTSEVPASINKLLKLHKGKQVPG